MARQLAKLTALRVSREKRRGYLADGGGLYLRVGPGGAKSWVFRFRSGGRAREMGLGSLIAVSLAEARLKAAECRRQRAADRDPIEERKKSRLRSALEAANSKTFEACWRAFLDANDMAWRNAKHRQQWRSTLQTYCGPINGLAVQAIDTGLVMRVLEPIWTMKPETASRVRQRIERVLDWARVRGYRDGENPARWKGHLDNLLPAHSRVRQAKHHPALAYPELPAFMEALRTQDGVAAAALEFAVLTAARTSEVIGARWDEIDLAAKAWTVPAGRMKARREHRVPLSAPTLAVLGRLREMRQSDFVFPGGRRGKPLSNMAMLKLLERMKRDDVTAHGFRSTLRDWAAERSSFPREVAEAALAHTIENKDEAAYRRGDLFEKRRLLMDAWGRYCASPPAASDRKVLSLKKGV